MPGINTLSRLALFANCRLYHSCVLSLVFCVPPFRRLQKNPISEPKGGTQNYAKILISYDFSEVSKLREADRMVGK